MCGRFTFYTDKELQEIDDIIRQVSNDINYDRMKTGEISPTEIVPILVPEKEIIVSKLSAWGFPKYQGKGVIINARAETAREKRTFRSAVETQRCVIPSTGFFEWDKSKKKYLFNVPEDNMLYMAGLFNEFEGERRFVILTTEANDSILDVHNRMPVVLRKSSVEDWIFDLSKVDGILLNHHPDLIKSIISFDSKISINTPIFIPYL